MNRLLGTCARTGALAAVGALGALGALASVTACNTSAPPTAAGSGSGPAPAPAVTPGPVRTSIDTTVRRVDAGAAVPDLPAPDAVPDKLVVGGEQGIAIVDDAGKVVQALTTTPVAGLRWLRDRKSVVAWTGKRELRMVPVDGRADTLLAKLPATTRVCGRTVELDQLSLQAPDDFALTDGGASVCVRLRDRHAHGADAGVAASVSIGDGSVTLAGFGCKDAAPDGRGVRAACRGALDHPRAGGAQVYSLKAGALARAGSDVAHLAPADYAEESVAPSGKWSLVSGNVQAGDEPRRDLYLLDREGGALYPLPEQAATWPAAVGPADLARLDTWSGKTASATAGTPLGWIGERLIVGRSLVTPGQRIVQLPGDLAR